MGNVHDCAVGGSPAQPSCGRVGGGTEAAVTFVFWPLGVWFESCLGIVGLFLGSVWSRYLGKASRSPIPSDGAGTTQSPSPRRCTPLSPTQHPHLKSPSWYFPNACRMMVTIAMRGFTMQN